MSSVVNNSIIISWNQFWIKDRITWLGRLCITPSSAVPCPPVRIWNLGESQFKNWAARTNCVGLRAVVVDVGYKYKWHYNICIHLLLPGHCPVKSVLHTHPPNNTGAFSIVRALSTNVIISCTMGTGIGWMAGVEGRKDREVRAAGWQLQYYCNTSKVELKNLFQNEFAFLKQHRVDCKRKLILWGQTD